MEDAKKDCTQIKELFEKHKNLAEEDPMMTNVHMQNCVTETETPAALEKSQTAEPQFNVLTDQKGKSIKELCLEDASNDSASVCVGSFKAIAKASLQALKVYYSDSGYSHGSIHSDRIYFDAPTSVMIVGFPLANAPAPKETADDSP